MAESQENSTTRLLGLKDCRAEGASSFSNF